MNTVKDFGDSPSLITDLLFVVPPEIASWVEKSIYAKRYRDQFEAMLTAEWDAFSQLPVAALFVVVDYPAENGRDEPMTLIEILDAFRNDLLDEGCPQSKLDVVMAYDAERAAAILRGTDGPSTMILELDENRLATLPAGFLQTLANSYGMYLDEKRVTSALEIVFAKLDIGEIPAEQKALEDELKIAMGTNMLVDP